MRKFAKPILIIACTILAAYVILVVAINLYLQSKDVQDRVRQAASEAAGVPVEIQGTCYIPWSGLVVSGVVVPHDGNARLPLLNVGSISIRFETFALLRGHFVVTDILIQSPVLLAFQKSDGSWSRPHAYPPQPAALPVESPSASPEGTPGPTVVTPPVELSDARVSADKSPRVSVERIRVRNGTIYLDDVRGRRIGVIEGVEISVTPAKDGTVNGDFKIKEINLFDKIALRATSGTFLWRKSYFEIPALKAVWGEGSLAGQLAMNWADEARFSASLKAADVSLSALATDAGVRVEGTKGTLLGTGEISGVTGHPATFVGGARIELLSARLQPIDFIRQIGDLMSIEELQMLELKEARAEFAIANEQVVAKSILMESKNLVIEASGPVGFDGRLDLDAKLHVNDKLRRDLRAILGNNLVASDREGYKALPFSINGTVSRPESDLLDKVAGVKLGRDVSNVLQNLLRMPTPKKQKKAVPTPEGN